MAIGNNQSGMTSIFNQWHHTCNVLQCGIILELLSPLLHTRLGPKARLMPHVVALPPQLPRMPHEPVRFGGEMQWPQQQGLESFKEQTSTNKHI